MAKLPPFVMRATAEAAVCRTYLRQYNVLGVSLALLGNGVHEGLGGQACRFGGCQALCHTVHVHILGKCFLHRSKHYIFGLCIMACSAMKLTVLARIHPAP